MALCPHGFQRIKDLWKKIDEKLLQSVDIALKITTAAKNILSSPVADVITHLIPGDLDDKIKEKAIQALTITIDALQIIEDCKDAPTPEEKIKCYFEHLATLPFGVQHAVLAKIASKMTAEIDGNRFKEHEYDFFSQGTYTIDHKK